MCTTYDYWIGLTLIITSRVARLIWSLSRNDWSVSAILSSSFTKFSALTLNTSTAFWSFLEIGYRFTKEVLIVKSIFISPKYCTYPRWNTGSKALRRNAQPSWSTDDISPSPIYLQSVNVHLLFYTETKAELCCLILLWLTFQGCENFHSLEVKAKLQQYIIDFMKSLKLNRIRVASFYVKDEAMPWNEMGQYKH